jgi:hypothetical protein
MAVGRLRICTSLGKLRLPSLGRLRLCTSKIVQVLLAPSKIELLLDLVQNT